MNIQQSTEAEIAVLKTQTSTLHDDLTEMKGDIKEIKALLSDKFVTKDEFEQYKRTQNIVRWTIGVVTAVITSVFTFEVIKFIR